MTIKRILGFTLLLLYGFVVFLVCTLMGAAATIVFTMPWWYILTGTIFGTIAVVLHYIVKWEMEDKNK